MRSLAAVRWDRLGRIGLLLVLTVVGLLYVERTLNFLATRSQANRETAIVRQLTRANAQLARQQKSLSEPATIADDARRLGMVRVGEHPYVITNR